MKKTKKIVALVVVMIMMLATVATVLTACDNSNTTIWVSESAGVVDLTKKQIEEFNKTWDGSFKISAKVSGVSESNSATQVLTDVESAPDIFCFAQDQTARLKQAVALSSPTDAAKAKIEAENDSSALSAVKVGGEIVCYPLTSDNGYFMMYDKSVITDDVDKTDLAALVAACEAANKNFSMETDTSAWYVASFFFGAGCKSEWTTDIKGNFTKVDDDFNSDAGLLAMQGMQVLVKSPIHISSSDAGNFAKGSAIVVTGTWGLAAAKEALGENLGFCELPYVKVGNQSFHLGSFAGNKLMGVKPQTDVEKAKAMHALAQYLTGEQCQLERFDAFGWGPSNLNAQKTERVANDAALKALWAQNEYSTTQGQIHGAWWDIAKILGKDALEVDAGDVDGLRERLATYEGKIKALFEMTEEQKRAWSVIGNIGGTSWDTDLPMVEEPANTWTSESAYELDADSAFLFRMGADWNYKVAISGGKVAIRWGGPDIENVTLAALNAEPGTYYLKIVITFTDDQATSATIELIPA